MSALGTILIIIAIGCLVFGAYKASQREYQPAAYLIAASVAALLAFMLTVRV